jgi:hypothetical protein
LKTDLDALVKHLEELRVCAQKCNDDGAGPIAVEAELTALRHILDASKRDKKETMLLSRHVCPCIFWLIASWAGGLYLVNTYALVLASSLSNTRACDTHGLMRVWHAGKARFCRAATHALHMQAAYCGRKG